METRTKKASQDQEWFRKGVDVWLIRENLTLSIEGRAAQHQKMLDFVGELNQIGRQSRERSSSPSQTTRS